MSKSRDINGHYRYNSENEPWDNTRQVHQRLIPPNCDKNHQFQDQRDKAHIRGAFPTYAHEEGNSSSQEIVQIASPYLPPEYYENRTYHYRHNETREPTHKAQETRLNQSRNREMASPHQKRIHDTSFHPAAHDTPSHQTRISAYPLNQTIPYELRAEERNHEMAQHSRYIETRVHESEEVSRERKWYEYFVRNPNEYLRHDFHRISRLKEIDKNNPNAQFKCLVCGYCCDSLYVVNTHIEGPKHLKALQNHFNEYTLTALPPVPPSQIDVISEVLENLVNHHAMTESDCQERSYVADYLNKIIGEKFPDSSVQLFGSSLHGMGLRVADLNLDLTIPFQLSTSKIFEDIFELLKQNPDFRDIQKSCDWEYPHLKFVVTKTGVQCNLRLHNDKAFALASLLKKYAAIDERVCKLAALVRFWAMVSHVANPEEGTFPPYCIYLFVIYYLQQMPEPILPVLNELYSDDPTNGIETIKLLDIDCCDIKNKWTTKNTNNIGELWLGFFKFYSVEFKPSDFLICITKAEKIGPSPLNRFFFVEPLQGNKVRMPYNRSHFNYVMHCIKTTYRYFAIPQTCKGPVFGCIKQVPSTDNLPQATKDFILNNISSWLFVQKSLSLVGSIFIKNKHLNREELKKRVDILLSTSIPHPDNLYNFKIEESSNPIPDSSNPEDINMILSENTVVFPEAASYLVPLVDSKKLQYDFSIQRFTNSKFVPPFCEICKKDGHIKSKCSDGMLCRLSPLPPPSVRVYHNLDILCYRVYERNKLSEKEIKLRDQVILELEGNIKEIFSDGKLTLFGSSRNGFCMKGSDLDICLTLENNKTAKGLDLKTCLEQLYQSLAKKQFNNTISELVHISTAKVPIVKFKHAASQLVGDFSVYNILGQENSKLLKAYADIDKRVVILGIMMKRFAKECRIGNASRGTLSSYAYTLMVIYFLQRCNTPVLPVLQELSMTPGPLPEKIIQGCNTYFFNNLQKLPQVWPEYGKNKKSVGHLWLELLCFYTEQFDPMTDVVCIRKFEKFTKLEAMWNTRCIAIEDPFELTHNLGATISRKTNIYIFQAFQKGRNHFASMPDMNQDLEDYYFNRNVLTDGDPPSERITVGLPSTTLKLMGVSDVLKLIQTDNNKNDKSSLENSPEEKGNSFRNQKEINSDCESIDGHSDKEVYLSSSRSDETPVLGISKLPFSSPVFHVDTSSYPHNMHIPWHFENPVPLVTNTYRSPPLHPYPNEEKNYFQSSIPLPFRNLSTNRDISQNNLPLTYQGLPLANNFPILKCQQDNLQGRGPCLSNSTNLANQPRPFINVPLDSQTPSVQKVRYFDFSNPNQMYRPLMQTAQNHENIASKSSSFIKQHENFQYSPQTDDKTANLCFQSSSNQRIMKSNNSCENSQFRRKSHHSTSQALSNEKEEQESWRRTIAKLCSSYEAMSPQPATSPCNNTDFSNLNSTKITPDMKYVNEVERQALGREHDQNFIKDRDHSNYKIP